MTSAGADKLPDMDRLRKIASSLTGLISRNIWFIFLLWSLWLTCAFFAFGSQSFVRTTDEVDSTLPARLSLVGELLKHGIVQWYPFSVSGVDGIGVGKFFQLDDLFFLLMPGWAAYAFIKILQVFIAGYFTFRLCRDVLKLDTGPSVVGGMAYAISFSPLLFGIAHHASMISQLFGEMGFPFLLWTLDRIYRYSGIKFLALTIVLGIVVASSSSFVLSVPFMIIMGLLWFLFQMKSYSRKILPMFLLIAAILVLWNVPYLMAMLANAAQSQRLSWPQYGSSGNFFSTLTGQWTDLFTILRSTAVFWIIGFAGLALSRLKDKRILLVSAAALFCAASMLFTPFIAFLKPYIGLVSGFQLDRFYNLLPFFLSLFVAFGLQHLSKDLRLPERFSRARKVNLSPVIFVLVIVILCFFSVRLLLYYNSEIQQGVTYANTIDNPAYGYIKTQNQSGPFRAVTVDDLMQPGAWLHPAYANANDIETADGYAVMYPYRYQLWWGKVIEPVAAQSQWVRDYFYDWGSRVYLFGAYANRSLPFSDSYNLDMLSLANVKYVISGWPLTDDNLSLARAPASAGVSCPSDLYVYENKKCLPRFFMAGNYAVFPNEPALLDSLARADVGDMHHTAFIEQVSVSNITAGIGFSAAKLTLRTYTPDKIELDVSSEGPGILVMTDTYSPYWKCSVDGTDRQVFPAYGAFDGIYIEGGNHRVYLYYSPPYPVF